MFRLICIVLIVVAVVATFPIIVAAFVLYGLWRLVRR